MQLKTTQVLSLLIVASFALSSCADAVVELDQGDCLDLAEGMLTYGQFEYEGLSAISCSQPHNAEVVGVLRLREKDFPGMETRTVRAEEFCPTAFANYIGKEAKDSILDLVPLSPTEESWTRANDRTIICLAISQHEKIPKTFKNSRR